MKTIPTMPSTLETGICEKHGAYEYRYMPFNTKFMVSEYCAKCADEDSAKRKLKEVQESAERDRGRSPVQGVRLGWGRPEPHGQGGHAARQARDGAQILEVQGGHWPKHSQKAH